MLTPYMNLVLPTPTVTLGPEWAIELNQALDQVDSHDHTSGKGVEVPTAGININADLGFNSWNATALRTSRYASQGAALSLPTDLRCVYVVDKDLFYNDGDGNQIRLTIGGAIDAASVGGISGMGSTTASVSYSSVTSTFSFFQNTNLYALMAVGDVSIYDTSTNVNPKKVTIKVIPALPADYSLTLPTALPASQKFMTLDNSGNIAAPWAVDGSTIVVASNTVKVPANGITSNEIVDGAIINSKIQSDPTFPGTNFGSAGSGVKFYGTSGGYNLNNVGDRTLLQSYSGTGNRGYRVIAGRVSSGGAVVHGEGFSSTRTGTGVYEVTPTIASSGEDITAIAIVKDGTAAIISNHSASTATITFHVVDAALPGTPLADAGFFFMAWLRVG